MNRLSIASFVAITLIASAHANEPFDVTSVVLDPNGKPVAGADVWLAPLNPDLSVSEAVAHVKTGADGKFTFGKELIGKLWNARMIPQVIVRDERGRLGHIYMISEFLPASPTTVSLADAIEIRGRIIGFDGKPVVGAQVGLRSFEIEYRRNDRLPILLPAQLLARYRTQTDSTGQFVIRDALPSARVVADISVAASAPFTVNWDLASPLVLKLPQPNAVVGRMTGPPDATRAGRQLMLKTHRDQPWRVAVDPVVITFKQTLTVAPEGVFQFASIPPGQYVLESPETDLGPFYFEPRKLEIKAGERIAGLELPLKPARKLRGQVVDAKGAGVPGVSIELCRYEAGSFGRQLLGVDSKALTGPDGWYEGHVVPARLIGVTIRKLPDGNARNEGSDVEAPSNPSATMPPIHVYRAESIVVRVVDANGKAVPGAKVDFSGAVAYVPSGVGRTTDSKGELRLPFSDRSESILFRATAGEAVSELRTINPADVREPIEMTVDSGNAFRFIGQVVDQSGRPVAKAPVQIMRSVSYRSKKTPGVAGYGLTHATLHTDSEGRFALSPLVAGDQYGGTIQMEGYQPAATATVTAVKGRTHDFGQIILKRLDAVVRGRVVDSAGRPLAAARVVNSGDAHKPLRTQTVATGHFELRGLTAGRVHVVAFQDGFLPAWVAAETGRPEGVTLTLYRRGEASPAPRLGIDEPAVRAVAKQVLEKLWGWPEARKSPVDKKIIEMMARLDPALARQWAGRPADAPDEPSIDILVEDDLDEALAQLATRDAKVACEELKRLAEKYLESDKAKANRLVEELLIKARTVDPRYRPFRITDAGRLMVQLGRVDAGRKLIEETAGQVEKLPADGWEGYVRGYVAGRLAPFDLPRARKMIDATPVKRDRDRYAGMCANALAPTNPKAARGLLDSIEPGFERSKYAAIVAFVMAPTHPESAARIVEECGEGSSYTARGLAWAALALAPRDKVKAHEWIDRAFRSIHERTPDAMGWNYFGGWGEAAAALCLVAAELNHPEASAAAAHVFAQRPTVPEAGEIRALEANVGFALMLAPVDRQAARTFLDIAEVRRNVIGTGGGAVRLHMYVSAVAFIDPPRALPMLNAEIDGLKAAGKGVPEHCDLLRVLSLMTSPSNQRLRAVNRAAGLGDWPTTEDIE